MGRDTGDGSLSPFILDTNGEIVVKYTYDDRGSPKRSMNFGGSLDRGSPKRRFISMDDVAYIDPETIGGTNLFAYCNNNPVMNSDPTGHSAILTGLIIGAIVGTVIGFGTVAYTDYQDDGQLFNGSVKWHEYAVGTITGAVLGAGVGAVVALGGQAIFGGLISVGRSLAVDTVFSLATGSNKFSSWQDYAVSFILGGLTKYGKKNPEKTISKIMGKVPEWIVVPIINQSTDYVFERTPFSVKEVATRIILSGMFKFVEMDFKKAVF